MSTEEVLMREEVRRQKAEVQDVLWHRGAQDSYSRAAETVASHKNGFYTCVIAEDTVRNSRYTWWPHTPFRRAFSAGCLSNGSLRFVSAKAVIRSHLVSSVLKTPRCYTIIEKPRHALRNHVLNEEPADLQLTSCALRLFLPVSTHFA
jgi:hypothetical protein